MLEEVQRTARDSGDESAEKCWRRRVSIVIQQGEVFWHHVQLSPVILMSCNAPPPPASSLNFPTSCSSASCTAHQHAELKLSTELKLTSIFTSESLDLLPNVSS